MVKVSIIIPIYNMGKYLARCLDSVINQSLADIEIICINDGSTDNSLEILKEYSNKDNRIIIISQHNRGMSYSRNKGISIATGEYIGFVDSDDFIDSNYYENLYKTAINNNADIACAGIIRENKHTKNILVKYDEEKLYEETKEKLEIAQIPKYCFVWNKIYLRKNLLTTGIKFQEGMFYEDILFSPNIIEKMNNIVTVKDTFYHYWKRSNSTIKNNSDKIRADKLYAISELRKYCIKYNLKNRDQCKLSKKTNYYFCGIQLLKVYEYLATKKFYLFGTIPILEIKEYI